MVELTGNAHLQQINGQAACTEFAEVELCMSVTQQCMNTQRREGSFRHAAGFVCHDD